MENVKTGVRVIVMMLPVVYMAAIWIMSSLPHDTFVRLPDDAIDRMIKESLHLVEFALLYGLIVAAFLVNGRFTPIVSLGAAVFASFYGLTDEIHQAFVPYRSATVIDAVKDVTGVAVAFFLVKYYYFERKSLVGRWMAAFSEWARPQ